MFLNICSICYYNAKERSLLFTINTKFDLLTLKICYDILIQKHSDNLYPRYISVHVLFSKLNTMDEYNGYFSTFVI